MVWCHEVQQWSLDCYTIIVGPRKKSAATNPHAGVLNAIRGDFISALEANPKVLLEFQVPAEGRGEALALGDVVTVFECALPVDNDGTPRTFSCSSPKGVGVHQRIKHGTTYIIRQVITVNVCPKCMRIIFRDSMA